MNNTKDDSYYLEKIKADVLFVLNNTQNKSKDEFDEDEILKNAVSFKFVQISENASKLSIEVIRNSTNIPWNKIKGMRNRIVHDYGNVTVDILYDTIKKDFPNLINLINNITI